MKLHEAVATHRATARPATPTALNAGTTRPRSAIATHRRSAAPANTARPKT